MIGLHGIQLFIDAGIPVDRGLVTELVRHVIIEKLDSVYGYPQPRVSTKESVSFFFLILGAFLFSFLFVKQLKLEKFGLP